MTPRFVQAALLVFGLFTVVLSSLTFASPSPSHKGFRCESSWQSWDSFDVVYSYVKAVSGLVLSLVIVVANSVTVIYLFRMQVRQKRLTPDVILQSSKAGRRDSKQLKAERSFAKILVILSLVCLVCWTPFMVSPTIETLKVGEMSTVRIDCDSKGDIIAYILHLGQGAQSDWWETVTLGCPR
jgi:hypothetical protein